jgi:sugar-phosphatase
LKGAELLGFKPADCLVIEDAPAGIWSARAAEMKVVGITSTYPRLKLSEADAVVALLAQIQVSLNGNSKLKIGIVAAKADSSLVSPP